MSAEGVRVSVVIPVFDTGPYLLPGLESLDRQELEPGQLEVVAVDDGSTDGSGEVLDDWARTRPHVTVLHQPNSGWPGQPRNRGTALARGQYVFYMDADDYLGDGALRRLADFADEHGSDIVVPRLVSVGGRGSDKPWGHGQVVDADLEKVFLTLMPQKLFRRSFLEEHALRFPEGKVRLEDGIFLSRAYLLAGRVSSLGDHGYYYKRLRETGGNISAGAIDPEGYTGSVRTISRTVRELCADPALADRIVLDLYRRKCLKVFAPDRVLAHGPGYVRAWADAVGATARELVPEELEATLPEPARSRSRLARAGDVAGLMTLARSLSETAPSLPVTRGRRLLNRLGVPARDPFTGTAARLQVQLASASAGPEGLQVQGRVRVRGIPPVHLRLLLELQRPDTEAPPVQLDVRVRRVDPLGWQDWSAVLPLERVTALPSGRWYTRLRTAGGELDAGVPVGDGRLGGPFPLPGRRARVVPYASKRGNLALRKDG